MGIFNEIDCQPVIADLSHCHNGGAWEGTVNHDLAKARKELTMFVTNKMPASELLV
jgi:hypothetical protein